MPLGFDPSDTFTLQFRLPQSKYSKPEDIARFVKSAIENVGAIPGVQSAALVRAVPFSGNGGLVGYAVDGRTGVRRGSGFTVQGSAFARTLHAER